MLAAPQELFLVFMFKVEAIKQPMVYSTSKSYLKTNNSIGLTVKKEWKQDYPCRQHSVRTNGSTGTNSVDFKTSTIMVYMVKGCSLHGSSCFLPFLTGH